MSDPYAAIAKPVPVDPYAGIATRAPVAQPAPAPTGPTSTAGGAFRRAAGRGVAPALGGAAGFGAGFATAGTLAAPAEAVPVAGPFLHGGLALVGGLAGAFGAGSLVNAAQDKVLSVLPSKWVKALGQDQEQRQADVEQHPYASFAGQMAPTILTMRPGMGGSIPLRIASKTMRVPGAAVGAGIGGVTEAGGELFRGEKLDPVKIGISTVVGAALNRPTAVGSKLFQTGGNSAISTMQAARSAFDKTSYAASEATRFGRLWGDRVTGRVVDAEARVIPQKQIAGPVSADPYAGIAEPVAPVAPAAPRAPQAPLRPVPAPVAAPAPAPPVVAPLPVVQSPAAAGVDGQGTEPTAPVAAPAEPPAPAPAPEPVKPASIFDNTPGVEPRAQRRELRKEAYAANEGAVGSAAITEAQPALKTGDPVHFAMEDGEHASVTQVGKDEFHFSSDSQEAYFSAAQLADVAETAKMKVARDIAPAAVAMPDNAPAMEPSPASPATSEQIGNSDQASPVVRPVRSEVVRDSLTPVPDHDYAHAFSLPRAELEAVAQHGPRDAEVDEGVLTREMASEILREHQDYPAFSDDALIDTVRRTIIEHREPAWLDRVQQGKGHSGQQAAFVRLGGAMAELRKRGQFPALRSKLQASLVAHGWNPADAAEVLDHRLEGMGISTGPKLAPPAPTVDSATPAFDPVTKENNDGTDGTAQGHEGGDRRQAREVQPDARPEPRGKARSRGAAEDGLVEDKARLHQVLDGKLANNQGTGPMIFPTQRDAAKYMAANELAGGFEISTHGSRFVLQQRKRAAHKAEDEIARERRRAERAAPGDAVEDKPDYAADRPGHVEDRGPYDPDFATSSFTNRASIFTSAAEALGMDPDKFTLLPAPRQVALLQQAMLDKYGVAIDVDRGMQERFAIDQMLDAYQNVQGMAHVLDLPEKAISLGGKLKLKFVGKAGFLGAYSPGQETIILPRRSNSFAHEWAHALDWYLLETGEPGRGLSGAIRQRGDAAETIAPTNVRDAFVDLLNAMFFDKAGAAAEIMQHEAKIAQTKSEKVKAAAQAAIDRLRAGNSQAKGIRSAFYKGAKDFDGPGGEYWTSPTEMFARAFEAYTSYKVEAAGLTTEFIGKGDTGYLSNAEERFAKTFPKGEERARIFAAFEQVFGHLADEQVLAQGRGAERPAGGANRISDLDKTPPKQAKEKGVIRREITAIKRAVEQAKKEAAARPNDAKGIVEKAADLNGATFMSMAANLRMIQARSGSASLQKLIDQLTHPDGRGDRTVGRTFHEDVHLQSKQAVNRLGNILKAHDLEHRTAAEDMLLRDLLVGAVEPDGLWHGKTGDYGAGVPIPANYVKGAAQIRRLLDNEFYVNQQAGIDLGYTRNGYLARVLDLPKVYHDQPGFERQATKVYELVYDKEFGTDPAELLADDEKRPDFLKLAGFLASKGADLPSYTEVRSLVKQIAQLTAKAKNSDDPDAINAQIAKLQADLEDVFAELHGEVRTPYAAERAEAWLAKINLVAGQEHNAGSPDSKYTKHRELPPEADKLMEQFYLSDPVESVTNYLVTSARRTAYARRFGADGKKRLAMFEGMAAEGVSPEDQRTVERILDTATGRVRSSLPAALQTAMSFINAAGTMALLPRATISSLAEPFTAGLVTGNSLDGFKMLGDIIGGALGSPSGKVRYELARAMGIVSDIASDDIMESRYGQTYADSTRWDRYTATMFRRTGLTGLTRAQKTHGIGLGHSFIDNLAQTIVKGGRGAANATALLRELGVRDPEAFSKELVGTNRMPTVEELDSPYGQDYTTAQHRFSRMVVQEPDQIDRPELASNPVGRVIYGITGFSYSYWRNIVKRNGILIKQMYDRDKASAALHASWLFGAAAVAYILGYTISTVREKLLNPKRWDELKENGELDSTMKQLAFTRTFSFGAADVAIQTYSGLKYQRDLSNAFVGAGPGFFLQNAQKISKVAVANSRKTNTAEYNAVQGAYSAASPFLAFGLARLPGGPLVQAASGAGMAYVTSPNARDAVATAVVGKKNTPKVRTPTAYDKFLDGAFGPKVPKKRE